MSDKAMDGFGLAGFLLSITTLGALAQKGALSTPEVMAII